MKLPIYLMGENSLALASLRQQLERDPAFFVEPQVYCQAEAFEHLRNTSGPVLVIVDLNSDVAGRKIVTSMRYNVTARCDTPNRFSIPSRCLTQSIDFYRPSSLPSRLFISSGSTTKCNIACLHSLPRVEKPGRGHPEKNLFRTGTWRKETLTSGDWHRACDC
jgi:hypothetical protein